MDIKAYQKAKRYAYVLDQNNYRDLVHDAYVYFFRKTGENIFDQHEGFIHRAIKWIWYKQFQKNVFRVSGECKVTFIPLEDIHLDPKNLINDLVARETDEGLKQQISFLVQSKKASVVNRAYDDVKQYQLYIAIYNLLKEEYKGVEIADKLGLSTQLTNYYIKEIKNHLKKSMGNLQNPFNGSKLKITRRVSLKTFEEKMDASDYEMEDFNEYYQIFKHIESGEGLLVRLPEQKTNPYIK